MNNLDIGSNNMTIPLFFLTKIYEKLDKITHYFQSLLKNVCTSCETFLKWNQINQLFDEKIYLERYILYYYYNKIK